MATLDERVIEAREQVDAFCDFDRTLITIGSHSKLHFYAVQQSSGLERISKALLLAYFGASCLIKDGIKKDNTKDLEGLAKVLKGVNFESAASYLIPKMRLRKGILRARENFNTDIVNLALLSKNDRDLIERALDHLAPQLEEFGFRILYIFGNSYEKIDRVYTGRVKVHVAGNKDLYFKNKPFIGDAQDAIRYKNHPGFIGI